MEMISRHRFQTPITMLADYVALLLHNRKQILKARQEGGPKHFMTGYSSASSSVFSNDLGSSFPRAIILKAFNRLPAVMRRAGSLVVLHLCKFYETIIHATNWMVRVKSFWVSQRNYHPNRGNNNVLIEFEHVYTHNRLMSA